VKHMTKFFNDSQIRAVLSYGAVVDTLDAAYADLARGQAAIVPRQRCAAGSVKFSSMGALWAARGVAATKSYPTVQGQFSFLINLFDTLANRPLAVMEAGEITRFRTSAQTAMVAARIKPSHVRKVALFGAGLQGRAQVEALSQRMTFDELAIVDPHIAELPVLELACKPRMYFCAAQEAVQEADMVITATRSQNAVLDGDWLKQDALVVAIGISSAGGREIGTRSFDRASRVIVEWKPQSLQEAGDVLLWLKDLPEQAAKIMDLPELYAAQWPQAAGIQIFKSVGTGLADTAAAWLAWQRLQGREQPVCV
jgi:ornithine cyclodeaminase